MINCQISHQIITDTLIRRYQNNKMLSDTLFDQLENLFQLLGKSSGEVDRLRPLIIEMIHLRIKLDAANPVDSETLNNLAVSEFIDKRSLITDNIEIPSLLESLKAWAEKTIRDTAYYLNEYPGTYQLKDVLPFTDLIRKLGLRQ
jgi:hypothetical protein